MAYNEQLVDQVRQVLLKKEADFYEKKMFGGLCFMVDDKMCIGITNTDEIMARIGPDKYEDALAKPGCKEMMFTGRAMKGYVFLEPDVIDMDKDLPYWVQLCLDFNPLAKASKKRTKKKAK